MIFTEKFQGIFYFGHVFRHNSLISWLVGWLGQKIISQKNNLFIFNDIFSGKIYHFCPQNISLLSSKYITFVHKKIILCLENKIYWVFCHYSRNPFLQIKDKTEFALHEDLDKMKDGIQKDLDKTKEDLQKDLDWMEDNLIEDLDKTKDDLQKNLDRTKDDLRMDLDKTEDDLQWDLDRTEDDLNEDPDYDVDVPDSLQQDSSDAENETEKGKVKSGIRDLTLFCFSEFRT